jgi:hypothetical protein
MKLENATVPLVNVIAIVAACFSLYFFLAGEINEAKVEAQEYAITLDIERDQDVIDMYLERLAGGIANPGAEARVESLREKIARREAQRALLRGN